MYQLLRDENIAEFNSRRAKGVPADMRGVDLRGLDLRNMNVDGVSFASANISGCYFPRELRAEEILASVSHGIRVRFGS
jgi:uncharacterized protein YjbI with pentapeptide repeats